MYGKPVKSPFSSHSTGRGEAAVNNHYIARGGKGESGEEWRGENPPYSHHLFFLSLPPAYGYFMHSFSPAPSRPQHPHLSSVCLNLFCFLALSLLLLSFLCAWWTIGWKEGGIGCLPRRAFLWDLQEILFCGVVCYSSLAHRHPKHQLSVSVSYGPLEFRALRTTNMVLSPQW